MYGQAHAGLGWVVGVLAPGSDRRLRVWCTAAAVLPDIDSLAFVGGPELYERWHHTFGHNVFLGALCMGAAAWHHRDRPWTRRLYAAVLVGACFASHLLTDMKLSGWLVELLWPFSRHGYEFRPNYGLDLPLNEWLVYGFMAAALVLAFFRKVTPLEIISPRLDHLAINAFRPRHNTCAACPRRCNNHCDGCGAATCMRHARINWRFRIACPRCAEAKAKK